MREDHHARSMTALNWLNFFAADISDGVGPFLAVYLASTLHWQPGAIGIAISATTLAMVLGQGPAGYVVDNTRRKRVPIIVASIVSGVVAFMMPALESFPVILTCQVILGLAASFYAPTLVALAATLAHRHGFDMILSKNRTYNHAGNVGAAVFTGVVGRVTGNAGIFYCMTALAAACTVSASFISDRDTSDDPLAPEGKKLEHRPSLRDVLRTRTFLVILFLTVVFYFSNGAMLPLVGQQIARAEPENSTMYLAACIVIAQVTMVPTVYVCGRLAGKGRKRLLALAFMLLALRGFLYTITDYVPFLLLFQVLDGMTAGMFLLVAILVVHDVMGTSGLGSFAQGMLATALSLGSTMSHAVAGAIVQWAGFRTGFIFLMALALVALLILWKALPETLKRPGAEKSAGGADSAPETPGGAAPEKPADS